ncbi:DUF2382 domain-containing protein [Luteipulveratus mongoliensis]|uniref:Photosystem reaction center subunit H n=1 Tax=Luteipulveratus mongoliensis TaxID=571913 RepID=A0A0K1JG43_9MICO|nr:PRC and DUF2382 domain-containing protein [Luteipulveratus mongoliensis]AKU15687.1 hypothetical protein VV02_07210 [Luteipulveratus mongoliensis]
MITTDQVQTVRGGHALDSNGEKIGSIGEVYLDDRTGNPAWVTVNTGLFGTSESFIPLQDASVEGKDVKVPYTKDKVKDAPRVDAEQHLDVEQEKALYRYYGVSYDGAASNSNGGPGAAGGQGDSTEARTEAISTTDATSDAGAGGTAAAGTAAAGTAAAGTAAAGTAAAGGLGNRDAVAPAPAPERAADDYSTNKAGFDAGPGRAAETTYEPPKAPEAKAPPVEEKAADKAPDTKVGVTADKATAGERDPRDLDGDGVVTRYEEQLHVATERREAGRVRLRKSVITEDQTVTVPLTREEVSLERFTIETPEVVEGDPFGDDVREFVLYEEVPVISKRAVAVERVGLRKNTVQENRQVTDKIRKEQIDLDGDGIPDNLKSGLKADDKGRS